MPTLYIKNSFLKPSLLAVARLLASDFPSENPRSLTRYFSYTSPLYTIPKQNVKQLTDEEVSLLNLPFTVQNPFYDHGEVGCLTNGKYCIEYNNEKYYMTYKEELELFDKYVDKRKQKATFTWKRRVKEN